MVLPTKIRIFASNFINLLRREFVLCNGLNTKQKTVRKCLLLCGIALAFNTKVRVIL